MNHRRAVFLDKDGTVIENVPYNVDPSLIRLCPGAGEGLRNLAEAGYLLVVVSNQSGVARGFFPETAIQAVEQRLRALLADQGVDLADFRYCPHHPDGKLSAYSISCDCRKPAPGMLLAAACDLGIDPTRSWMIGDIPDDVEAGCRAGCRSVLIDHDGSHRRDRSLAQQADLIATDLVDAARQIQEADES